MSAWLPSIALLGGTCMAVLRFARDRPAPVMLSKVYGLLASAGLALLIYGWATVGLPKLASIAPALLAAAAAGGLATSQAWRCKDGPAVEVLLFGHLSITAMGLIMLVAAAMTPA
jgi:hypothetical protein